MNLNNMSLFKNTKKKIGAGVANKKAEVRNSKHRERQKNKKIGKIVWEPFKGKNGQLSSQQLALALKHISELLYTGSRFIGKTDYLIADFCQDVSKGYGADWVGMFVRTVYSAVEDGIKKAKKIILNAFPQGCDNPATYNASMREFRWKQGEILKFRAIRTEDDYENKAHGNELPWLALDEVTSWESDVVYTKLKSCNRAALRPDGTAIPVRVRTTCNPSGIGKLWVREYFVKPAKFGEVIKEEIVDDDGIVHTKKRICIMGNWRENPHADLNYIRDNILTLKKINYALYKEWSDGDWWQMVGTIFAENYDPIIHNIENFEVPRNWSIWWSYDDGDHDPYSALFYAESDGITPCIIDNKEFYTPKGSVFVLDEIYGAKPNDRTKGLKQRTPEIAKIIKQKMEELLITVCVNHKKFEVGICEYMMWQGKTGTSGASIFKQAGFKIKKCKKQGKWSIENRVKLIKNMLSASKGDAKFPHIYFCDRVKMLKVNLMSLVEDENKRGKPAPKQADHDFDSLTYGLQKTTVRIT